jgi:hypothetical protein
VRVDLVGLRDRGSLGSVVDESVLIRARNHVCVLGRDYEPGMQRLRQGLYAQEDQEYRQGSEDGGVALPGLRGRLQGGFGRADERGCVFAC